MPCLVRVGEIVPARGRDSRADRALRACRRRPDRGRTPRFRQSNALSRVAAALLEELRGLAEDRDLLAGRRREREAVRRDVDELLPVVRLLVDRPQELDDARPCARRASSMRLERRDRALRPGRRAVAGDDEPEHRLELVDRGGGLVELRPRGRVASARRHFASSSGQRALLGAAAMEIGEIAPPLAPRVEPRERVERAPRRSRRRRGSTR